MCLNICQCFRIFDKHRIPPNTYHIIQPHLIRILFRIHTPKPPHDIYLHYFGVILVHNNALMLCAWGQIQVYTEFVAIVFVHILAMRNLMVQELSYFKIRRVPHQNMMITVGFLSILLYICNILSLLSSLCVIFNDHIFQLPINMRGFLHFKENERLQRD